MTAIYPGSFDPITNGHIEIIRRAAAVFERVVVAVMVNSEKRTMFTGDERVEMVKTALADIANVETVFFAGLTVELCREYAPSVLVKGVRTTADFDYEAMIAEANKAAGGVDTVLFMADPALARLNSLVVREFASHGGKVSQWVPENVNQKLKLKFENIGG